MKKYAGDTEKDADIEKVCALCVHAVHIAETENCVCQKKGVVKTTFSCGKFKLDLLKLTPALRHPPVFMDDCEGL